MTSFERCFNVRRMYVSAIDDQKVFQPPQNMEFTVKQGTEIPRPQPGAFIAAQPGGKNLCRGVGALVVRHRHARTFEGDLAHHRVGETLASLRIANHDLMSRKAPPATRHGDLAGFDRDGRCRVDLDRPPSFQTSLIERGSIGDSKMDWFTVSSNRNQKRVLGKSVARHHAVESTRPERGLEPGERCGPDRFGAVEGEFPRGEIQGRAVFRGRAINAEVAGETRTAAIGRSGVRHRPQPADRTHRERFWIHEMQWHLHQKRGDQQADQPHVVVERHPADRAARRTMTLKEISHREAVGEEICLGEGHRRRIPRRS